MPCLCPRPERGNNIAAKDLSAIYIAKPADIKTVLFGFMVKLLLIHAHKSKPAEPSVAKLGIGRELIIFASK